MSSTLFKISSLNGLSVLIKVGIGLVTSKVLAIFVGPTGLALVGNLRNFLTSIESISTLGFQNGIVKYVAENKVKKIENNKIVSTLFFSLLLVTGFLAIILFVFASYLNQLIFGLNQNFTFIFRILAFVLPIYVASLYLISIVNGLGKFENVIYINIIGNIIGLFVTVFLVYQFSVLGALLAIIITPTILFFVSLYFVSQEIEIINQIKWSFFDFEIIKNLSHYFLMTLASGILGPIVYLAIRNHVIETVGLKQAGFCEAISRISTYYLLFVNTLITVYYFPKLVVATTNEETKKVFYDYYKNVLILFGIGLFVIYLMRNYIVKLLFTQDFEPVSNLFLWQLIGDFFKASSLILGFQFFAKKMTKAFIFTEILSLTILYFSSIYCVNIFKTEGVVIAHAFTYGMYLLVLGIYFRKSLV